MKSHLQGADVPEKTATPSNAASKPKRRTVFNRKRNEKLKIPFVGFSLSK